MKANEEYVKRTRMEFSNVKFRKYIEEELGSECFNCGSDKNIEYHHIVPVVYGGTNNIKNIVPLCVECHYKAHRKSNAEGIKRAKENGTIGRKHNVPYEECLPYLKDYIYGKIGKKEFKNKCGYSEKYKLDNCSHINRFKEENNISEYRNTIDIININGSLCIGKKVGYILYNNGTKEYLKYDGEIKEVCEEEEFAKKYLMGSIGEYEYRKKLGYSKTKNIENCKYIKKIKKKNKIDKIVNIVDQVEEIKKIKKGYYVGYLVLENGEKRDLFYMNKKTIKGILRNK